MPFHQVFTRRMSTLPWCRAVPRRDRGMIVELNLKSSRSKANTLHMPTVSFPSSVPLQLYPFPSSSAKLPCQFLLARHFLLGILPCSHVHFRLSICLPAARIAPCLVDPTCCCRAHQFIFTWKKPSTSGPRPPTPKLPALNHFHTSAHSPQKLDVETVKHQPLETSTSNLTTILQPIDLSPHLSFTPQP